MKKICMCTKQVDKLIYKVKLALLCLGGLSGPENSFSRVDENSSELATNSKLIIKAWIYSKFLKCYKKRVYPKILVILIV